MSINCEGVCRSIGNNKYILIIVKNILPSGYLLKELKINNVLPYEVSGEF